MSPSLPKPPKLAEVAAAQGNAIDSRYHPSAAVRRQLNKVFPTHWSFLLGEIALYSFIVLLITGVYLTLFFDPSMAEVTYNGVYQPLRGVQMSGPHCFSPHRSWCTWPASSSPARSAGRVRRTG